MSKYTTGQITFARKLKNPMYVQFLAAMRTFPEGAHRTRIVDRVWSGSNAKRRRGTSVSWGNFYFALHHEHGFMRYQRKTRRWFLTPRGESFLLSCNV